MLFQSKARIRSRFLPATKMQNLFALTFLFLRPKLRVHTWLWSGLLVVLFLKSKELLETSLHPKRDKRNLQSQRRLIADLQSEQRRMASLSGWKMPRTTYCTAPMSLSPEKSLERWAHPA